MAKLVVDGVEIEYSDDEMVEVIEILREDKTIKAFGSMREQQDEIVAWMREQKEKEGKKDGDSGNGDPDANSGNPDAKSDDGERKVDEGGENSGQPSPPPVLTDEEKQESKPKPKRSRWWGDAIEYDGE